MPLKAHKISTLNEQKFCPIDLFICCASFEDRCLTIPKSLNSDKVKQVIIAEHVNIPQVKNNAKVLTGFFQKKCTKVSIRTNDPIFTADNMMETINLSISKFKKGKNIVVDVSTFTHESLLILLNILYRVAAKKHNIFFVYNSASDYSIGATIEKKWLSNGIKGVRTVLGFSGNVQPNKKTHLILFVGYESKRATQLIEALEPSSISLGYGEPGTATNKMHEKASNYFHDVVRDLVLRYSHVQSFAFSCNNPLKVKQTILEQAKKYADHNIVIAPMNTKLSTIGIGLAALENDAIQLCYAQAIQYNFDHYSTPSDKFYSIALSDVVNSR